MIPEQGATFSARCEELLKIVNKLMPDFKFLSNFLKDLFKIKHISQSNIFIMVDWVNSSFLFVALNL